ncbi:serine/threonine protein kinase psk1 [Entophlyctis luteolus]|nr:serine/threonine protein kinase psk1 [Entophlyctis luteolus]
MDNSSSQAALSLGRLAPPATASPRSALSSLLSASRAATMQGSSSAESVHSDFEPDATTDAVGTPGGSSTDPTLSFRIRNYSAVELDEDADNVDTCSPDEPAASGNTDVNSASPVVSRRVGPEHFERLKVFLVRQKEPSQIFAMKVLKKATLVIHTKTVEHTKNERDILSQLAHPFIVKLHYAFQTPERLYLILQYAPGGELFSHLSSQRMFDEDTAAFYIGELVCAIEHLHGLGIIYRDLKPENVLLDADGHILLTDFGLSKVALGGSTRTICGTVEFTAPEVLDGTTDYGPGVDHWSLGVMLYDMLTGSPPFTGNSRNKVMQSIMTKKLTFPVYVTSFARDLITKLLKKDPTLRIGYVSRSPVGGDNTPDPSTSSEGKLGRGRGRRASSTSSNRGGGAREIKTHSFFRKLNWTKLERRELEPPILPNVADELDTSNFDDCFTGMTIESPPVRQHWTGPTVVTSAEIDISSPVTSPAPTTGKKKNKGKKKLDTATPSPTVSYPNKTHAVANGSENSLSIPLAQVEETMLSQASRAPAIDQVTPTGGNPQHHFYGFSYVAEDGFLGKGR